MYIHFKGTGKVEDAFDFEFMDAYMKEIQNKSGVKKTY